MNLKDGLYYLCENCGNFHHESVDDCTQEESYNMSDLIDNKGHLLPNIVLTGWHNSLYEESYFRPD